MKCQHCGKSFRIGTYVNEKNSHSRYCDDTCRTNHHNEKRKLFRQMTNIIKALDTMRDVEQTSNDASNIELAGKLRELASQAIAIKDKKTIDWNIAQLRSLYK